MGKLGRAAERGSLRCSRAWRRFGPNLFGFGLLLLLVFLGFLGILERTRGGGLSWEVPSQEAESRTSRGRGWIIRGDASHIVVGSCEGFPKPHKPPDQFTKRFAIFALRGVDGAFGGGSFGVRPLFLGGGVQLRALHRAVCRAEIPAAPNAPNGAGGWHNPRGDMGQPAAIERIPVVKIGMRRIFVPFLIRNGLPTEQVCGLLH